MDGSALPGQSAVNTRRARFQYRAAEIDRQFSEDASRLICRIGIGRPLKSNLAIRAMAVPIAPGRLFFFLAIVLRPDETFRLHGSEFPRYGLGLLIIGE
jgi:hypothetical protein